MGIDIITVTYNNLDELIRTYSSLKSQSDHGFHWIVIDGSSEDFTRQWLEKLQPPFSFHWISEPDNGIYNAMNKGRSCIEPSGYTIFMNSGDELYGKDVIQKVRESLVNYFTDGQTSPLLVYGDAVNISADGTEHHNLSRSPEHALKGMVTSHQAMFFNNQLLTLVGFDEHYRLSGDYDLMCKFIAASHLFNCPTVRLPVKICKFYLDGVSGTQRQRALREDYLIRRHTMGVSHFTAIILYLSHQVHYLLKKLFPKLMFSLRSK